MTAEKIKNLRTQFRKHVGEGARKLSRSLSNMIGSVEHLPASDKEIHMLSCAQRLPDCLLAYQTFCFHSGYKYPLVVHDDGSIPFYAFEALRKRVADARLITRQVADECMANVLQNYPHCSAFRRDSVFFLKFFDFFQFCKTNSFIILDNDILFFDRPKEVVTWVRENSSKMLFNKEHGESFAFSLETLALMGFRPKLSLLNAGFGLVHCDVMNLELCERFLAKCRENSRSVRKFHLVEQTAWAVLLEESSRPTELLPSSYEISNDIFRSPSSVMRHYTGFTKHDIMYVEALIALPKLFFRSLARAFL
jgi:hypothetical protein